MSVDPHEIVVGNFEPFVGEHCETSTTGNLLKAAGLELSEPMLFGVGEGLGYGVFVLKSMDAPFIGGRSRPESITKTLADNVGFELEFRQSRSPKRAWANIASFVDGGQPVAAKLNSRLLDYFTSDVDFAGHYVAVYGYDEEHVFVVDTDQQGGPKTTDRERFEEGRLWKGLMSSNALTWTIEVLDDDVDWPAVLRAAIAANANAYLTPPIKNFGAAGIRKTAKLIEGWYPAYEAADLAQIGTLIERGGTGGGLFRYMYAEFLREAHSHLDDERLVEVADHFDAAGSLWTGIADRLERCVADGAESLERARHLLLDVADLEEAAVTELAQIVA